MGEIIDLDAYRNRRIEEGTWPPGDPAEVIEYWQRRRDEGKKFRPPPKPKPRSRA